MKIGIVGLGLIGGSLAKTISKKTSHTVCGYDIDESIKERALRDGSIAMWGKENAVDCDITFVCLYPKQAVDFINENNFSGIVCDICGVKGWVYDHIKNKGIDYVGAHPMAGREFSGYLWSEDNLFEGASFIITKAEKSNPESVNTVANLAKQLEFGKIVITTVEEHDRVIAYTSQLAHVVSNAYVKSDTANRFEGYSAGSFQDLTRVARLDPDMWTQLFLMNPQPLSDEIGIIIENLKKYKEAIDKGDSEELRRLLKEGSDIKKRLNGEV